jgi:hypothetical protein
MNLDATNQQKWSDLLAQAVTQPGLILKARPEEKSASSLPTGTKAIHCYHCSQH